MFVVSEVRRGQDPRALTPLLSQTNEIPVTSTVLETATSTVTQVVTVPAPFPVSDCPGFVSQGKVPWAVYETLDINSPGSPAFGNIPTREACHNKCAATPGGWKQL